MEGKSTKQKVLEILEENSARFISGQEIAEQLYVTRNAVFKAVTALRSQGYEIEAVSHKGYRLCCKEDELSLGGIRKFLQMEDKEFKIEVYEELESTNDVARQHAVSEPGKEMVVIADSQRAGRGRRGRYFHSPKGMGIYLSFAIFPKIGIEKAALITCMAAVALTRAIEKETGIETGIKWVNDIYLNNKKIAGILTEGVTSLEDGILSHVVVGIGLNIYESKEGFPEELKKVAGALLSKGAAIPEIRNRLCASIIKEFMELYHAKNPKEFMEEYREKSFLVGKCVKINSSDSETMGHKYAYVTGIDDMARLLIRYEDGQVDSLFTGEVSVVEY